ncbi:MAG: UDP-N-acetylmuramoyl-L-alanine--D-glutamate ligase [Gammaproteobacteria bacterium]|nr:UDP-N-acetylmuramoyl-L-alanine--D-glutamate ligase [Gammaproteobacteria bacterium]
MSTTPAKTVPPATRPQQRHQVAIIGLGLTGLSCARYCRRRGWSFFVADTRAEPPLLPTLRAEDAAVEVFTGMLPAALLTRAERIVLSPGLPLELPELAAARAAGVPIVGDIELFLETARAPVIAITGANGKSTVTTLVAALLTAAGRQVRAGGNLAPAALDLLGPDEPECYVLELSSFQLERTPSLRSAAATLLNISPDHFDRHGDLERYAAIKRGVYRNTGCAVLNRDDPRASTPVPAAPQQRWFTLQPAQAQDDYALLPQADGAWLGRAGQPLLPVAALRLAGRHNVANALAACALVDGLAAGTIGDEPMRQVLREFPGLPHRCQWVARVAGVDWYDDSKATNIGAAVAAIEGLYAARSGVVIAGGQGKGADFTEFAALLARRLRAVVLLGQDAPLIRRALPRGFPASIVADMPAAVAAAAELARPGDAVALAPACASLDMFSSYAARGDAFAAAVRALRRC